MSRKAAVLAAIAIIVAGVSLTVWWYAGLRNRFYPDNFGVVEPGRIYRSAQISQYVLRKTLERNHIGLIIDLAHESSPDALAECSIAKEAGVDRIEVLHLGGDGTGDPNGYLQALEAIVRANRQGTAVLVHCSSGAQRTGGVIATYRMLMQGKSDAEAFAEAQKFHHSPHSNPLLIPFVENHLSQWKAQLAADHMLPGS